MNQDDMIIIFYQITPTFSQYSKSLVEIKKHAINY